MSTEFRNGPERVYDEKYVNEKNSYYTQQLFYETTSPSQGNSNVLYTLKEVDHRGYPSIKRLYLEMEDLTEYEFANEYFANWTHWQKLCKSGWFKEHVEQWREELELKIKARSLNAIKRTAKSSDKEHFQANKYLLEKGYAKESNGKSKSAVGRPSKEKIEKEAQRLFDEKETIKNDAERLLN